MSNTKEIFLSSGNCFGGPMKKNKKLVLGLFALFLLVVTVIVCVATGVTYNSGGGGSHNDHQAVHAIVKSSCRGTFYPDICFFAMSSVPDATRKIKSIKDVIDLLINLTEAAVEKNYIAIKKLDRSKRNYTEETKTALRDCIEMVDETLGELSKTKQDLRNYPSSTKSISRHADDLKILLSAAMTNQETCLDGFSHEKAAKKIRKLLLAGQLHVFRMCSNSLAMIKNLTDMDMAKERYSSDRKLEEKEETEWPEWLSAGDRRLLQATTLTPNVVVAADGSGTYRTVSEAVEAAPNSSSSRYIIKIKAGVYRENVEVPTRKTNIMFVGDGRLNTIITASRNVVDGSTTFNSATVAIVGDGFMARDITFQNAAGPSKHQAVALRVGSDLSAFYRCGMLAYQDTLYVHNLRQFYVKCIVIGSVDFIFGNAAALFQDCDIHARRPNPSQKNMVTAQGRDDPNQNTGIVIQKCRIGATQDLEAEKSSFPTYLGRPWKEYSRTVIMQTEISDVIDPAGWYEWDGNFALDTLFYGEYQNTGPGANTTNRVTWKGFQVITDAAVAQAFTARNFIAGNNWLDSTGFPYSLDL